MTHFMPPGPPAIDNRQNAGGVTLFAYAGESGNVTTNVLVDDGLYCTMNSSAAGNWFRMDFGKPVFVVEYQLAGAFYTFAPAPFTLARSLDDTAYTNILTQTAPQDTPADLAVVQVGEWARYLRLHVGQSFGAAALDCLRVRATL